MYDYLTILSGRAHPALAAEIAAYLNITLGRLECWNFPDGEIGVRLEENIRGRDVFIVQPTSPPVNESLMELLVLIDACRRASAERITAVMPYYGYARQDRKDAGRVPITAKLVANLIVEAGASRVLAMDLHAAQIQGFFDIPVDHLYAAPVFYKYISSKKIDDLVVVSPDVGGMKMAAAYSQMLGSGLAIVAKRRKSAEEIEALYVVGDVEGKNVLIVDDITETAGTLTAAARILKKAGAKSIYAGVSHAVLNELALKRLKESDICELITTNSTPPKKVDGLPLTVLCVAELLGEAIKRVHMGESVSSLFDINKK